MRLAAFGDVHGNLAALEAVLEDISHAEVDGCVVLGDIVNTGPDSKSCLERVQNIGCPIVRGNHERYVAQYGDPAFPEFLEERFKPVAWSVRQLGDEVRASLLELPMTYSPPEAQDIIFVHSSCRKDNDNISLLTPEADLQQMFASCGDGTDSATTLPKVIIRAHNHLSMERRVAGTTASTTIVTVGSAGLPLGGVRKAQYIILSDSKQGWQIEHRAVAYDVEANLERFETTGYLEYAGPAARLLMREFATATHQLGPFLREFDKWTASGQVSLEQAVTDFLNAY
ncbi:MAG: metallophosphoesterase [Deinococcota bacterium]